MVKARVVKLNPQIGTRGPKMRGLASKAAGAHLRYLEREGVTRDGEKGRAYSSFENEADGRAFIERGREDRHQFRFIVAPEDAAEIGDLRGFTRDLMLGMEKDLDTGLDWIAVDHHNTGHPHTHIILRGITDDGKILNIAGDYISHGIRHRASELVTLELGHQSEIELANKLRSEVEAERLTRLDKMLLAEQREQAVIDLRPGAGASYPVRENRHLLIGRAQTLERYGLATETEPGRWIVSGRAETVLKELGERVYLVIDGIDGRVHHMEFADPARVEDVRRGIIVEPAPAVSGPRPSDKNIAVVAEKDGIYRPGQHLDRIRDSFEQQGKDPGTFVRSHVRRLEALRRAGHVERIDEGHWRVPKDIGERGQTYDLSQGGEGLRIWTLSTFTLEQQIGSDGATRLDRELASHTRIPLANAGFGRDVADAIERRKQALVDLGHATRLPNGRIRVPSDFISTLERAEVTRVGRAMAAERGLNFQEAKTGEYVSGRLAGSAQLASGRFAMIETLSGDGGLGFSLVPWQPVLDKRIGQHITGTMRGDGGIEWSFGRKRGQGL